MNGARRVITNKSYYLENCFFSRNEFIALNSNEQVSRCEKKLANLRVSVKFHSRRFRKSFESTRWRAGKKNARLSRSIESFSRTIKSIHNNNNNSNSNTTAFSAGRANPAREYTHIRQIIWKFRFTAAVVALSAINGLIENPTPPSGLI